jgi:putative hydrolase of the HAD superfamily
MLKHIIFDLDNTLWDFSGNSKKILGEIFEKFELQSAGIPDFENFHKQYKFRNEYLWNQYAQGNVSKEQVRLNRFHATFNDFGINNYVLANTAADHYIYHTRRQTDLLPNAIEVLNHLKQKYTLHIITNGFDEVQFFKLENTGLKSYFETVTTAEAANALKPDIRIFNHALKAMNTEATHCLYIGDSPEVDGHGAINAGMQFILVNTEGRENKFNYNQVTDLAELMELL